MQMSSGGHRNSPQIRGVWLDGRGVGLNMKLGVRVNLKIERGWGMVKKVKKGGERG